MEREREGEFFIANLLVRIHFITEMIWWTGLAPWAGTFLADARQDAPSARRAFAEASSPLLSL